MYRPLAATLALMLPLFAAAFSRAEPMGIEIPRVGVRVVGPTGWTGRFVSEKYAIARWDRVDPEAGNVRAVIVLRAFPDGGRTLAQFADAPARDLGGRITDRTLAVDGHPAWRIDADQGQTGLKVRAAFVTRREGVAYVALVAALFAEPWEEAAQQVLSRWTWIPLESPARRLRNLDDVHAVFLRGLVQMPLPAGMGTADPAVNWNESDGPTTVALLNYRTGRDEFEVTLSSHTRDPGESFDVLRTRLLAPLRARTSEPVEWRDDPERLVRRSTPLVKVASPGPAPDPVYEQLAAVETSEDRLVLLTFRIITSDPEDRAIYQRQAAYMFYELLVARRGPKAE